MNESKEPGSSEGSRDVEKERQGGVSGDKAMPKESAAQRDSWKKEGVDSSSRPGVAGRREDPGDEPLGRVLKGYWRAGEKTEGRPVSGRYIRLGLRPI